MLSDTVADLYRAFRPGGHSRTPRQVEACHWPPPSCIRRIRWLHCAVLCEELHRCPAMLTPVQRAARTRAAAAAAAADALVGSFIGSGAGTRAVRPAGTTSRARSAGAVRPAALPSPFFCLNTRVLVLLVGLFLAALHWYTSAPHRPVLVSQTVFPTGVLSPQRVVHRNQTVSQTTSCSTQLDSSTPLLFVGGQGGSGTRGVWAVLKASAVIVRSDRFTRDSLALREAGLVDGNRGVTPFLTARSHNFSFGTLHPALRTEYGHMLCKFQRLLAPDVARFRNSSTAVALAIKEPRTMYLLPLLVETLPSLRFLHLTRDPRTVSNWHVEGRHHVHLRMYGVKGMQAILAEAAALGGISPEVAAPRVSSRLLAIKMWSDTQRSLMAWCRLHLARRGAYMHLRVEDLYVRHDEAALARLFDWMGFDSSAEQRTRLLSGGKGHEAKYVLRERNPFILAWVDHVGGDVLDALGYPRGSTLKQAATPPPVPLLLAEAAQLAPDAAARVQSIFAGQVPRSELEVVLCRYDENPRWVAQLAAVLTVYNTGAALPASALPPGARVSALPNLGRESGAYLHHIVSNYDNLAELTVFSHAGRPTAGLRSSNGGGHMRPGVFFVDYLVSPLFAFTTVIQIETKARIRVRMVHSDVDEDVHVPPLPCFDPLTEGHKVGKALIFKRHVARRCAEEENQDCTLQAYWAQHMRQPPPPQGALWFTQGARFSATAAQIRRRPRSEYERFLATVNTSVDPSSGYFLEVLWWYIITSPSETACPQPPNLFV